MTWVNIPSTFIKITNHLNLFLEYICIFEYTSTLHLLSQICSNLQIYKTKWNLYFSNILFRSYSNIIWKSIVKFFQNFDVGYIQTCTSLESNTMWHPKGDHHNVFSPWNGLWVVDLPLNNTTQNFAFICKLLDLQKYCQMVGLVMT
jgi:hypothetical protein